MTEFTPVQDSLDCQKQFVERLRQIKQKPPEQQSADLLFEIAIVLNRIDVTNASIADVLHSQARLLTAIVKQGVVSPSQAVGQPLPADLQSDTSVKMD